MITDKDFSYIRDLVRARCGLVLSDDKHYLVETRLSPLLQSSSLRSIAELVSALRQQEDQLQRQVVELMMTNETYFFRDVVPFDVLHQVAIPTLAASRAASGELAIWSAACSTGQEPYSIALLLREEFQRLSSWKVRILASDISTSVLARARLGRYSQYEISRGLPPHLLKHVQPSSDSWTIRDDVRGMVEFRQINLLSAWDDLPTMDIIFLRNVLIYFSDDDKRRILSRIRQLLRPDGYLFLGGAESTMHLDDHFERMLIDRAGCYRLRGEA